MAKYCMKVLCIFIVMVLGLQLTACGQEAEATDTTGIRERRYAWPLGTSSPEDTVTQLYAVKFAEEVERLSDGKMRINIFSNGTIGNDKELLESCRDGDIPFVVQNTAPQVSFMPKLAVFDIPAAFSSIEDARKAIDNQDFYDKIYGVYGEEGYKLLGIADQGFRVMTTNKRIERIEDFRGQKIRTMDNSNHLEFWKSIGANPTPMAFSEVYIGLQQNTIDAEENPLEVIVSGKLYEQQKYVIKTNHLPHFITLIVSDEFFQTLNEEEQDVILQAADTAKKYARIQADERIQNRLDIMAEFGVEIIELPDDVFVEMQRRSQDLYDRIISETDAELVNHYIN